MNVYNEVLNSQDEQGWTPLATAIIFNKEDAAQLFLDLDSDINITSNEKARALLQGCTPLQLATMEGMSGVVKKLLEKGAVWKQCGARKTVMGPRKGPKNF